MNTIIQQGIRAAEKTRSGLRLPLNSPTEMEFAVTDETGEVLGLYRMPDAQTYAVDDAVAKARNVAYYDNPSLLQPYRQGGRHTCRGCVDDRTFRYLAGPRYPEGIDGNPPGPFSILNETGVIESPTSPSQAASSFQSVVGFDAFNPQSNFHDPYDIANQNGISFSPGGVPLYKTINGKRVLVGGLGVSGDLPDQNDTVAASAAAGYEPPNRLRVDQYSYRAVRLPYQKFSRNPDLPAGGSPSAPQQHHADFSRRKAPCADPRGREKASSFSTRRRPRRRSPVDPRSPPVPSVSLSTARLFAFVVIVTCASAGRRFLPPWPRHTLAGRASLDPAYRRPRRAILGSSRTSHTRRGRRTIEVATSAAEWLGVATPDTPRRVRGAAITPARSCPGGFSSDGDTADTPRAGRAHTRLTDIPCRTSSVAPSRILAHLRPDRRP